MQEDSLPGNGQQRTLAGTTGREFIWREMGWPIKESRYVAERRQANATIGVGAISRGLLAKNRHFTHDRDSECN